LEEINIKKLEKSVFNTLYEIDTRERSVEKDTGKTKINYLPWATTYSEVCKHFSDVKYTFKRNKQTREIKKITKVDENTTIEDTTTIEQEIPYTVTDTGLEVRTSVTIDGIEKEMNLPVYDTSYRSMGLEPYTYETKFGNKTVPAATFGDIYKAIMRCFAKNLSMFGVGLNLWTKEDAPESVLQMNKLQAECMELITKRSALSEGTKEKVAETCKEMLSEENGDPRLCEDNEVLEKLKKKLMGIRKI
jgi:hypothetical protein